MADSVNDIRAKTSATYEPVPGIVVATTSSSSPESTPPGTELAYAQITSPVSIVSTAETSPTALITLPQTNVASQVPLRLEFYAPYFRVNTASSSTLNLYQSTDGGTTFAQIGRCALTVSSYSGACSGAYEFTPLQTGPVVFRLAGWNNAGTADFGAGATGGSAYLPAYLRLVAK